MQISLVKAMAMAGAAAFAQGAMAETISVRPDDDLASAIGRAADGDVVELAPGRYELSSTLGVENRRNLTLQGKAGGAPSSVITTPEGAQMRLLKVANCENVIFRNLTFTGGVTAPAADDALSASGGAVLAANVSGLTFESCAFAKNCASNGTAAVDARGGALALVDSTTVLRDCTFTFNAAVAGQDKAAQGGAIYASNAAGADGATWRVTLAMTNTTIRANWVKGKTQAGAAIAGTSAGLEAYNCLVAANGYGERAMCAGAVESAGAGSFVVFTQSTLSDNMTARAVWNSDNAFNPVFIRSAIVGQAGIGERWNWSGDRGAVLIDSVYQQNDDGPLAPLPAGKSVRICGKSFEAGGFVRGDPLLAGEGEALSPAAKARDAGWRPVDNRAYATICVSPDGSDATGTGSEASPFRSLTKAVSVASCGAAIRLAEGSYSPAAGESLPIDLSFRECLTIRGAGAGKTLFNGEQGGRGAQAVRLFTLVNAPQTVIADLTLTGGYVEAAGKGCPSVALIERSNGLKFENVSFVGNSVKATEAKEYANVNGLLLADCSSIGFYGCSFRENVYQAFRRWGYRSYLAGGLLAATACSVTIDRCEFRDLAIDVDIDSQYGGKTSYKADGLLLYLDGRTGAASCRIRNSLFSGNGKAINNAYGSTLDDDTVYFYLPSMGNVNNGCKEYAVFENNTVLHDNPGCLLSIGQSLLQVRNSILSGKGGKMLTLSQYGAELPQYAFVYNTLFERASEEDESLLKFCNYSTEETVWTGDAKFKSPRHGDYRLTGKSELAIDRGALQPWMPDSTDLGGNARLVGYFDRREKIPDLGCYELRRRPGFCLTVR